MVLFQVSSHFQLICAIIVKLQMLGNVEADLHLDDGNDFSGIIGLLKSLSLFRHIECSVQMAEAKKIIKRLSNTGIKVSSPMPNIWEFKYESEYTDIYFGNDSCSNKMYYYRLVEKGQRPKIHILDEGMATYYKDIRKVAANDVINHRKYKKAKYIDSIVEQLLFNPQAYCLQNTTWDVVKIPAVNRQTKQVLLQLYGSTKLSYPQEQYIFLSQGGYQDHYFSNEVDLLNLVAQEVGKENIVVKLHPRCGIDMYSKFGYKVWGKGIVVPWEVMLLEHDMSQQTFVTIFSSAAFSPQNLLGQKQRAIFLYKLFEGNDRDGLFGRGSNDSFKFLNKIIEASNIEQKHIYYPDSKESLIEILRYFNGCGKRGNIL